jgi:hypothetical protein
MERITLTEEQMDIIRTAIALVYVYSSNGELLATIDPYRSSESIQSLEPSTDPCYSGGQVQRYLKLLEEAWNREGALSKDRMKELLDEIGAAEGR